MERPTVDIRRRRCSTDSSARLLLRRINMPSSPALHQGQLPYEREHKMSAPSLNDWMSNPRPVDPTDPDSTSARAHGYFVASVMQREHGKTYSVWTHSVATALPKTDVVMLLDNENATAAQMMSMDLEHDVIEVPWDVLAEHLGDRFEQRGTRYYVRPEDFPDEATRASLGRPMLVTLDDGKSRARALRRLMPRIMADPAIDTRAQQLGKLPIVLLVDPTEEFNLQRLEQAPMRVELREQILLVFLGRIEERIVYTAEPWARLVATN